MEFLDIVNDKDEVVGRAPKDEIYEKRWPHRIVEVVLFNDRNELALQLRSMKKKGYPGYWAPTASGHVHAGESYEQAAVRELEEETGVTTDIKFAWKEFIQAKVFWNNLPITKILAFFTGRYDGSFVAQLSEVDRVEFFSLQKIKQMINSGEKMHPELLVFMKNRFGL